MKERFMLLACCLFLLSCVTGKPKNEMLLKLWYDKPASEWEEALPIDNGRLGAMILYDLETEAGKSYLFSAI
ncbi:glycoside hydrolase N-terminal domain-containing protein [Gaoshiqia sp. Z1-71]|uniref:glycoside hydrolase N-terminal domain-containing protein n=1 Tax=Gaoshiqia hydrogeniformans TaxID=3290090 RepID=UPI003BF83FD3